MTFIDDLPFNELTPEQTERFALLSEECGEVVHILGKIFRHGTGSINPVTREGDNHHLLGCEVGDLLCAIDILVDAGHLDRREIEKARLRKHASVEQWLHYPKPDRKGPR